jgi:hypothetical protein
MHFPGKQVVRLRVHAVKYQDRKAAPRSCWREQAEYPAYRAVTHDRALRGVADGRCILGP